MFLVREVEDIAQELAEKSKSLTKFEALQIAVQIQKNRVLSEAFCLNHSNHPGALEKIAMELEGLSNIASAIEISQ